MNNREWLNTLSDEDYAEEWLKIEKMLHGDCGFHIEVIMDWLSQPHETTADEDFAEIGFINKHEFTTTIQYTDNEGRLFFMAKCGTNSYSNMDGENADWTDDLIDQIRTIADKKRKEMGWK